jgi:hypothetical protein
MASTSDRIHELTQAGLTDGAIAAILNLTRAQVEDAQRTLDSPDTVFDLGTYTIDATPAENNDIEEHGLGDITDLGAPVRIVMIEVTLLAVDYDTDNADVIAAGLGVDYETSPDGVVWSTHTPELIGPGIPGPLFTDVIGAPAACKGSVVPFAIQNLAVLFRYVRPYWGWFSVTWEDVGEPLVQVYGQPGDEGERGVNASATFSITATVT